MIVWEITGLILALVVMAVGMLGCIVPGLPGTPIVLLGAVLHRLVFPAHSIDNLTLGILVGITLLSLGLDYLATVMGTRKYGASWKGILGVTIGGTLGLFFPFPGILIGPFLGALAFEWIGGSTFKDSSKAGWGAFVGLMVGAVGKVACAMAMIGCFILDVAWRGPLWN